jgi:hypothetical protein
MPSLIKLHIAVPRPLLAKSMGGELSELFPGNIEELLEAAIPMGRTLPSTGVLPE